ncbi:hypothetical protein [Dyadobacter sp. NIV53]|uniref:hypothetical protein n=1 Tax=Dyadobacter sp. NIV53 TaxID=2861765 RepID=UPI001C868006|nr:hypothetical protein [Dyadobacter sp. NIV53]
MNTTTLKPLISIAEDTEACQEIFDFVSEKNGSSFNTKHTEDGEGFAIFNNDLKLVLYNNGKTFFEAEGDSWELPNPFKFVDLIRSHGYDIDRG